jgi:hypothetical protein
MRHHVPFAAALCTLQDERGCVRLPQWQTGGAAAQDWSGHWRRLSNQGRRCCRRFFDHGTGDCSGGSPRKRSVFLNAEHTEENNRPRAGEIRAA